MGLKFKVENLNDVAEEHKKLYTERDGAFYLDVEGMPSGKTDEDVKKLQNALEKERNDHKAAKEKIRSFVDEFGDSESIRERFDELENLKSSGGKSNEELLDYKKRLRATEKERDSYKTQFEARQKRLDELEAVDKRTKVHGKLKEIVEALDAKYDKSKIYSVLEDYEDMFELDDVGDLAPFKGKALKDWIPARADLFNFYVASTPGGSKPGNGPCGAEKANASGDVFEQIADTLHG